MVQGILIDLDNTLYDYNIVHNYAINCVCKFAKTFTKKDFLYHYEEAKKYIHENLKNTASSHNRILYFQKALELLNIKDLLLVKTLYEIYWSESLKKMKLFDGVIEFLASNSDKQICLVTDLTAYIQYCKIEKLGLQKYIKYIVTSEEVGIEKPNKKMFQMALEKINLNASEVCMIGDSYSRDIQGAQALKIKAYWKTEQLCKDKDVITFNNFNELMGIKL